VRLTRAEIAALIPHAGAMCLLDGVVHWDENRIRCMSRTHLDGANPLRTAGRLPAVCGIEYAAQAMAVHGGLVRASGARPRSGYLASVRNLTCRRERLDDLEGELIIEAERLMGDEERVLYEFRLTAGESEVLSGRAAVVLKAETASRQSPDARRQTPG
jgi:predicted hotdog family 3-hydroxylacyl-ACP dehydratase